MSKRPVILIILDGWGIGAEHESNPIYAVRPRTFDYLKNNFPWGSLQASGISVGLPWNEEGNSEAGHLNIGTGKIVYQAYPKISLSIRDKSFPENAVLKQAIGHAKDNNSRLHLAGIISEQNVHASLEHLNALISVATSEGVHFYLHLFTDGIDSSPQSALSLIKKLPLPRIATISGRFYATDKDKHWARTQQAFAAILGKGPRVPNIEDYIKREYEKNTKDEYIAPAAVEGYEGLRDNDAVIFFNFREDSIKQIASPFALPGFDSFPVSLPKNLFTATMVPYDDNFDLPALFRSDIAENPLGKVLSQNGKVQFRIAESYKYAHITYFFNGLEEAPFPNEYRVIIPSLPALHPEEHPEMMAEEITSRLLAAIEEKSFDFILANFANPDRIAHTGDYEASIEAVKVVDREMEKIVRASLEANAYLIITSDHGNIERMFDPQTGKAETMHDSSPVPIYFIAPEWKRKTSPAEIRERERRPIGILADVAPTVLDIMKIPKPGEMTGKSLLKALQ